MEVMTRLRKALWPFCSKAGIFEDEDRVDLYGPVWIMITLIVEIAIVGFVNYHIEQATMAIELQGGMMPTHSLAYYSLEKVARSAFVIYFYFVLNPLLLLLIIKYVMNVAEVQYLWLFGIYGYSYTIFVLTTALNVVPLEWLRWSFLCGSAVVSLCVIVAELVRALKEKIKGPNAVKFAGLIAFLVFSHGILVLAMKKYFLS